jgi:hypothetical protein
LEKLIRADLSTEVQRIGEHKCASKVRAAAFAPVTAIRRGKDDVITASRIRPNSIELFYIFCTYFKKHLSLTNQEMYGV